MKTIYSPEFCSITIPYPEALLGSSICVVQPTEIAHVSTAPSTPWFFRFLHNVFSPEKFLLFLQTQLYLLWTNPKSHSPIVSLQLLLCVPPISLWQTAVEHVYLSLLYTKHIHTDLYKCIYAYMYTLEYTLPLSPN